MSDLDISTLPTNETAALSCLCSIAKLFMRFTVILKSIGKAPTLSSDVYESCDPKVTSSETAGVDACTSPVLQSAEV